MRSMLTMMKARLTSPPAIHRGLTVLPFLLLQYLSRLLIIIGYFSSPMPPARKQHHQAYANGHPQDHQYGYGNHQAQAQLQHQARPPPPQCASQVYAPPPHSNDHGSNSSHATAVPTPPAMPQPVVAKPPQGNIGDPTFGQVDEFDDQDSSWMDQIDLDTVATQSQSRVAMPSAPPICEHPASLLPLARAYRSWCFAGDEQ
jgi:hypothetical protein